MATKKQLREQVRLYKGAYGDKLADICTERRRCHQLRQENRELRQELARVARSLYKKEAGNDRAPPEVVEALNEIIATITIKR